MSNFFNGENTPNAMAGVSYDSYTEYSGAVVNFLIPAAEGVTLVNFSGVSSTVVLVSAGLEQSQNDIYVKDAFGKAAAANIVVSGNTSEVTFDGASTSTISTAYGVKHFHAFSGTNWLSV